MTAAVGIYRTALNIDIANAEKKLRYPQSYEL